MFMGSSMSDLFLLLTVIARVLVMLALRATSRAACLPMLRRFTGFFPLALSTDFPLFKLTGVNRPIGVRGSDAAIIPPIVLSMLY